MLGLQVQLFPNIKQEIERVVCTDSLKGITELKTVLLEGEDI